MSDFRLVEPKLIFCDQPVFDVSGQCDCGDCDCACVSSPALESNNKRLAGLFERGHLLVRPQQSRVLELNNDYAISYSPFHRPTALNHSALALLSLFNQPCDPRSASSIGAKDWSEGATRSILEQMLAIGLLEPKDSIASPLVETSTMLSAWLHITDRCNLRCAYCYLPHKHDDLSVETGYAVVDSLFRSALNHTYPQVKLKYAGGEPLLCLPTIVELHQYAQLLADRHGLALDGVVLSNGTLLTPEIIQVLQSLNLRLMISLDGLGKYHNCQRHFADGQGSFDAVARAVDLALSSGLTPDISITVSGRNVSGLSELMHWVLDRDLPFGINFYRVNDLSTSEKDLQLEERAIVEGMLGMGFK